MTFSQLNELAHLIDKATNEKDESELRTIITKNQEYVETLFDSEIKATLYYFLSNAWSALREIRHKQNTSVIWHYEQDELNQEIIYLRKARNEEYFSKLRTEYKCAILTNLANIFSHAGRTIQAIRLYSQALNIESNFFMAQANRGVCFLEYARLDHDEYHRSIFAKFAYDNLKGAINKISLYINKKIDAEYHTQLHNSFLNELRDIEAHVNLKFLKTNFLFKEFAFGRSRREQIYRKWALHHTLFLNPLNDLGEHSIAAHDPLHLPPLITNINSGFPKYFTYFNQLKQEYITYRHLLFEGTHQYTQKFYDKGTSLIDDYDYNILNHDIEKIKLAFRGFYSLFDKIAYFLNEYFDLKLPEKQVDFKTIWKNKDNHSELNQKFNHLNNLALRGLYFINKDLFYPNMNDKSFISVVEPEAQKINEIRNYLEHKFINIKALDITNSDREKIPDITIDDLEEKTLNLARMAREALIYLSATIYQEERIKNENLTQLQLTPK